MTFDTSTTTMLLYTLSNLVSAKFFEKRLLQHFLFQGRLRTREDWKQRPRSAAAATSLLWILQHWANSFLIRFPNLWNCSYWIIKMYPTSITSQPFGPLILFRGCILDGESQECDKKGIAKDWQMGQLMTFSVSTVYVHQSCPKMYKMGRLGKYTLLNASWCGCTS